MKSVRHLSAMVVAAAMLSPAGLCQSTNSQTAPVPANIVYRVLFHQVNVWLKWANQEVAQGITNGPAGQHWQNVAGLTNAEDATLKSVASDCQSALANIEGQIHQLTGPYGKNPLPAAVQQQLASLLSQRANTIASHIQQLQTGFAPGRFQILDTYVRNSLHFSVYAAGSGK